MNIFASNARITKKFIILIMIFLGVNLLIFIFLYNSFNIIKTKHSIKKKKNNYNQLYIKKNKLQAKIGKYYSDDTIYNLIYKDWSKYQGYINQKIIEVELP